QVIANPQLKGPKLRPIFLLLVLANLYKNLIPTDLQRASTHVLVHAHAVVIFVSKINLTAIEEYLDGIVAAGPKLNRLFLPRIHRRTSIPRGAHVLAESFIEIDDSVRIVRGVVLPGQGLVFLARISRCQIDAFLRRISSLETFAAGVVEWTDKFPLCNESELRH